MATLLTIDELAGGFADARGQLADVVAELQAELDAAKRKRLRRIKELVGRAAEARSRLEQALQSSTTLFIKPRTIVLHGVKVGFQKGKGALEWEDDLQVVKLIRKHFPEQFDLLVRVTERPNKDALAQLSAAALKSLSVTIVEAGDQVVIKPADSEVDKLVDALLRDAEAAEEIA